MVKRVASCHERVNQLNIAALSVPLRELDVRPGHKTDTPAEVSVS
jgi:hypothetical protein